MGFVKRRWRHLARRGKDLLLCGKNLAIEPCYKANTEILSGNEWYASVEYPKTYNFIDSTFGGRYYVGSGLATDIYIYTDEILDRRVDSIAGFYNGDPYDGSDKITLYGKQKSFAIGASVTVTFRRTYKLANASGVANYPNSKPKDKTYTETFTGKSGLVTIVQGHKDNGEIYFERTEDGVGYITKYDQLTNSYKAVMSIDPPKVNVWSEHVSETVTTYEPADDDDNY